MRNKSQMIIKCRPVKLFTAMMNQVVVYQRKTAIFTNIHHVKQKIFITWLFQFNYITNIRSCYNIEPNKGMIRNLNKLNNLSLVTKIVRNFYQD